MGTKEKNLERYLNLWKLFEKKLKEKKFTLSSFSKEWEKRSDSGEENDYEKFYDKLKKMKQRKDKLTSVQYNSIIQMNDYIKFLDREYIVLELENIGYDTW